MVHALDCAATEIGVDFMYFVKITHKLILQTFAIPLSQLCSHSTLQAITYADGKPSLNKPINKGIRRLKPARTRLHLSLKAE
jgi:hypothetical protein